MTSLKDVAQWMLAELKRQGGTLYQEDAVDQIQRLFGTSFVYDNEAGNLAISKTVLAEFRKLTETTVVWERGERLWRWRESGDDRGRSA